MSRLRAQSWRGLPVPITVMWSHEAELRRPCLVREVWGGAGTLKSKLTLLDDGISVPGKGHPLFARLHLGRIRRVVAEGRCQICLRPLGSRCIAINAGQRMAGMPLINDGYPMHPPCACRAIEACPGLKTSMRTGIIRCWLVQRRQWDLAWRQIGIAEGPETDERINALVRESKEQIMSGPDLILRSATEIKPEQLLALHHSSLQELGDLQTRIKARA